MYAVVAEPISRKVDFALGEVGDIQNETETGQFVVLDLTKLTNFEVCVAERILTDNEVQWFNVNPVDWDSDNNEYCEYEDLEGRGFNLDRRLALNENPCEIFGYGFDDDGCPLAENVDPVAAAIKNIKGIVYAKFANKENN